MKRAAPVPREDHWLAVLDGGFTMGRFDIVCGRLAVTPVNFGPSWPTREANHDNAIHRGRVSRFNPGHTEPSQMQPDPVILAERSSGKQVRR
jgi:hypothetical protein